jgi:16S rRNA (adenine1518-N6/adenine1519-N6)-dimethyltransferase
MVWEEERAHSLIRLMNLNYDSPRELRAFLEENGLGMRKKFGQNFLIKSDIRKKLVDALEIEKGSHVWEIGSGLGSMTAELLERGARVTAFEIDPGFARVLRELFGAHDRFTLIEGDIFDTWQKAEAAPFLLGNLPYNIGASLLAEFIEKGKFFKRMVVTVQNEVALRAAAKPLSADYSSFSVLCASAYQVHPLMLIKGPSFYPVPRVDSRGLRFDLRTDIDPASYPVLFYPLLRGLFSSRRKMIKNNLQSFVSSGIMNWGSSAEPLVRLALEECGLKGDERAETLGVDTFKALAEALERNNRN